MRLCSAVLAACLAAGSSPASSQSGSADSYPSKPIHIVVGYAPGGGLDIVARLTGAKLQEAWGKAVVIENKPAANALLGLEYVSKAAPDGYTLLMHANSGMSMNPFLYAKLPYDPVKDFTPISVLGIQPLVVVVHPSQPFQSLQELIGYAKANPGKLNYSVGATTFDVASQIFTQMAQVDIARISYKGSGPAATALVSGEVQMAVIDPVAVMGYIKSGKLRVLAVTTSKRVEQLPGVPTVMESAVPGYEMGVTLALFAPAAVPREIVNKLYGEIARMVKQPDMRSKLVGMGVDPVGYSPEETAAMIRDETAKFGPIIKAANIKLD